MDHGPDLGEFLRSRRARLAPQDVGLPDHGGRRRVPGLRREELARLAGISPGYYTRLEQGTAAAGASDAVLDALARVLRLDGTERRHLYGLARPEGGGGPGAEAAAEERLRPSVRNMIASLGDTPALVLGRFVDVLAWNHAGHALLAGHLPFDAPDAPAATQGARDATQGTHDATPGTRDATARPNVARMMFFDPRTRALYADRAAKARDTVGDLRLIAGRWPDAPQLTGLIAELRRGSTEFEALWAEHPVRTCATHARDYRHPVVGPLTLTDELLTLPDDPGQRVVIYHAEPGSPSAGALRRLVGGVGGGGLTAVPRRT
ncbi:transcriptional regulator [Streptomyces nigrescens]|uniref:Transcriptional regulator n=1 Tax=Streptomyces nigrescens TaxID=1920 RepID=A0ABM7ZYI4_STRNI|nr:helix-turn-helix transcriptional regulator [Streptomyces nigrescens]BDM71408.1 transcriptional regulator [Streptomyces nigrescens]